MSDPEAPTWHERLGQGFRAYAIYWIIAGIILTFLLSLLLRPQPASSPNAAARNSRLDEFPRIQETLRSGADLAACRSILDQLNRWLGDHPEQQPNGSDAGALKQLRVSDDEIQWASSSRYPPLDAPYLELAFLFAEAARALDVDALPPPQRAQAAFDWVCRQVRLREQPGDPYPAHMVLRRGWGSSLERAVVFTTLLEHLGMTGCFIDCPLLPAGGRRFWLAGARADGQVYLFEPRVAVPLRNATGEIATLEQLRQQPDLVHQLDLGGKQPYDVTAEQAAAALAQPAGYLSALTPRMRYLQDQLADPVKLSSDAGQLVKDFQPQAGKELMLWNFTRLLRIAYPPELGGVDQPDKQGVTRGRRFVLSLIDGSVFPRELAAVPQATYLGQQIYNHFEQPFLQFYFHERSPRGLLIRGRLDEATAGCIETIERAATLRARQENRTGLRDELLEWLRLAGPADQAVDESQGKTDQVMALRQAEEVWKKGEPVQLLLAAAAAGSLAFQADYALALAKHEQAEQAQRHAPGEAGLHWRTASERWQKHRTDYPGTHADARLHHARALAQLGQTEEALMLLENPPASLDHWNRHAHLIRARALSSR